MHQVESSGFERNYWIVPYNVTQDLPIGVTENVTASFDLSTQTQLISDLQGIGNGVWIRYQQKWAQVETSQGVYTYTHLDHAIATCNSAGIKILVQVQSAPSFRQTLDGLGNDAKLSGQISGTITSLPVNALRAGTYIPAGITLTLNPGGGTAENVVTATPANGKYTGAGATAIPINSVTLANTHNAGELAQEQGGVAFANASDWSGFMALLAARYNGQPGSQGKADAFQVGNEEYDSANRVGSQQTTANWDGSVTWDNGGAILAPAFCASRQAILAQYPGVPVLPNSVRRTSNTAQINSMSPCIQHVQNWTQGFAQNLSLGQVPDWFDFHFYHGSDADFDNTLVTDPTKDTYFDSAHTKLNSPSISRQLGIMQGALSPLTPLMLCGEFGWDLFDDGTGVNFTLNQSITAGQQYLTFNVQALPHAITNGEPMWIENSSGNFETVYSFGAQAINATSVSVTTDPRGNGTAAYPVAKANWTAAHNHNSGVNCYAGTTTDIITPQLAATYFTSIINAMNAVKGKAFCFTDLPTAVETPALPYPAQSTAIKSIGQNVNGVWTLLAPYQSLVTAGQIAPGGSQGGGGGITNQPPVTSTFLGVDNAQGRVVGGGGVNSGNPLYGQQQKILRMTPVPRFSLLAWLESIVEKILE